MIVVDLRLCTAVDLETFGWGELVYEVIQVLQLIAHIAGTRTLKKGSGRR